MDINKLNSIRDFFNGDRFATGNGAYIEDVGEGYAKCSMKIQPRHLNARNAVMGGAIFTLADFAFAVATNYEIPNCVSLTSQITYLSPAKGDTLIAEANVVKDGRSTCYYEVSVTDNLERKVAAITVTGFHVS